MSLPDRESLRRNLTTPFRVLSLGLLLATLQGCPLSSDGEPPPAAPTLLGRAYADAPISDGTVKLYDSTGRLLQEKTHATGSDGQFALTMPEQPTATLRVEVSGGSRGTQDSGLVLRTYVDAVQATRGVVYLNAATTLVAASLDRSPKSTWADMQTAVVQFLKLPDGTNLGRDLDNPNYRYFSHQRFLDAAAGNGGFDAFIRLLSEQVVAGNTSTYNFALNRVQGLFDFSWSDVGDFAEKIGRSAGSALAGEALGPFGATLAGMGFDAIFGGGSSDISNVQALQATVTVFNKLDTHLLQIDAEIKDVKDSIAALETSMNKQFGLANYNTKVAVLVTPVSQIQSMHDRYIYLLTYGASIPDGRAQVDSLVQQIMNEVPGHLQTIHNGMMDSAGLGEGAITLWHRVVANNNRNGENGGNSYPYLVNALYAEQLNAQFEYFQVAELMGLNLLVEARNYKKDPNGAKYYYELYISKLNAQQNALATPRISNNVLISPIGGVMWYRKLLTTTQEPVCAACATLDQASRDWFNTVHADWQAKQFTAAWFNNETAVNNALQALAGTTGYADWRLPTGSELMAMGMTGGSRTINSLKSAGLDLSTGMAGLTPLALLGKDTDPAVGQVGYVSLWSGYVGFNSTSFPLWVSVLPARTHKVDPLATRP